MDPLADKEVAPGARAPALDAAALADALQLERPGRHPGFRSGAWIWLLRHGEVHADWLGKAYGGMDVPLSTQGERDTETALRTLRALPFDRVLSSSLARAHALGAGLARATGAPLSVSAALAEIHRGAWQGRSFEDLRRERPQEVEGHYADPWNVAAPGGETDRDVLLRAWPEFARGVAAGGKLIAVACHYNVMRVLLARMLGLDPKDSFQLRIDLSGACLVHDAPEGWKLLRTNVRGPDPWPPVG